MREKNITTKVNIIFDIDSTSIGGLVVRYHYDRLGSVIEQQELFSMRKNITNGKEFPFEKFFEQTIKTFNIVADEVYLQALVPINNIYVNVSVPWMSAQKRIINYKKNKPFILDQKLYNELIEKESNSSLKKNIDYADHRVELIDRHTIGVYANGYSIRNPINKEMNDISIHSLISVMSVDTKESFIRVIESVFSRSPQFISNTFSMYKSVITLLPHVNDAIVIDFSGEVTETVVVQNDHIQHIGSIPIGTHGIVRSLRDELGIPFEKAESIIAMYNQEHFDSRYQESIQPALDTAFKVWFKGFYNLLDEYGKQGFLPNTIIVKAHNDVIDWCIEEIARQDTLREHIYTKGRIQIIRLHNYCFEKNNFSDVELAMLSNIIIEEKI